MVSSILTSIINTYDSCSIPYRFNSKEKTSQINGHNKPTYNVWYNTYRTVHYKVVMKVGKFLHERHKSNVTTKRYTIIIFFFGKHNNILNRKSGSKRRSVFDYNVRLG